LSRQQAQELARAKGLRLPEQTDYSLAEIYRRPVIGKLASDAKIAEIHWVRRAT
jgi:hypothetical protein